MNYYYPTGADPTQPLAVTYVFASGIASPTVTITAVDTANGSFPADDQLVTVTPIAPGTAGVALESNTSITVNWVNSSHISTGTTVLLSTDGVAFFEAGSAASGATSTTISGLSLDTQYWAQVATESANGESNATSASSISTPYVAPTLVLTPESLPTGGSTYQLNFSATYADNTPAKDRIADWQVNWDDGGTTQHYGADPGTQSSLDYGISATSATVDVTAVDGTGRDITDSQTVKLSPPAPTGVGGTINAGGTIATITWYGSHLIPGSYIIERQDPGATSFHPVGTVDPSTYTGTSIYGDTYSFTNGLNPSIIGGDGGYLYRVAAKTTAASGDDPGTPGVSLYCDAFGIGTAPNTPTGVIYDTEYDGNNIDPALSTSWSPTIFNSAYLPPDPLHYTKFVSGDSTTFTVSNLPPHMSFDLQIGMVVSGTYESGDTVTMTGPTGSVPDVWSSAADFANTGMEVEVPDINGMSTASFTITANLGGTGRYWQVDGATLNSHWGGITIGSEALDVGGETDLPVTFSAPDFSSINGPKHFSDVVLNVVNYDTSVIQPLSDTVTIGSDGTGTLRVKGVGFGSTPIILQDAIGDEGVVNIGTSMPGVTSSGSVTEGVSSSSNRFTFSIPYTSITDVTIDYNTDGSTYPGGLGTGSVTIYAGDTSAFVDFNPGDDGEIAPTRDLVVNLPVPNVPVYEEPIAIMLVNNNDKPTITMKAASATGSGLSDSAVIPLDPQGDNSKLTDIHMDASNHDGTIDSWTLSWRPGDFLMWRNDKVGTAGTDLASAPMTGGFGAHFDAINGVEYYTGKGAPPTDIYGQDLSGSTDWDATFVGLSVQDFKGGTDKVGDGSVGAYNQANGTANGPEILYNDHPVGGMNAGTVVVGQGVSLSVVWVGPGTGYDQSTPFLWNVGNAVAGYNVSAPSGDIVPLDAGSIIPLETHQSIHLYWVAGPPQQNVSCTWDFNGGFFSISTTFSLVTPSSFFILNTDDTTKVSKTGFPQIHLGPSPIPNASGDYDGVSIFGDAQMPSFIGGTLGIFQFGTFSGFERKYGDPGVVRLLTYLNASDGNVPEEDYDEGPLNHAAAGARAQVAYNDSPLVSIVGYNYVYINESFKDYMMYKPDGDGIWVPLRKLNWSWGGQATGDGNHFLGSGLITPPATVSSSTASIEPTWDSNIPTGGVAWTQVLPLPG